MYNNYKENKKLNKLIDPSTEPIRALANRMSTTPEDIFEKLSIAYDKAIEENKLSCDSDGIWFETNFAEIILIQNKDLSSAFDYYPKFKMKESDIPVSEADTIEKNTDETIENTPILPENLDENVIFPSSNLIRLNRFITGIEAEPSDKIIEQLKIAYLNSKKSNKLIPHGDAFNFQTELNTRRGEPIRAAIKPCNNIYNPKAWVLNYVGYESKYSTTYFTSAIEKFADLGHNEYLHELAELARNEKWYFEDNEDSFEILKNYVAYTFYKLQLEDKICISKDGTFAAFNTGLVTAYYEDIYMCFKNRGGEYSPAWKYSGVCTAACDYLGKRLVSCFAPLPQPAEYMKRKEDIFYDMNKDLFIDAEHVILERLNRIPTEFLRYHLADSPEAIKLLGELETVEDRVSVYDNLREVIASNARIYESLRNSVQGIVNKTVKIIRWNYRLPIPSYYPKENLMNLLLPMDFTNCGHPQAALVVQLTESGNYIGHTLLSMRQAYLNARLISSQESSWLTA